MQFWLIFSVISCHTARRIVRPAIIEGDDDMVFVGDYRSISFSTHLIHDISDETMFYEFLQSNDAVTKHNLESFINESKGTSDNLSEQQFDDIINKWIYQMLPGSA